MEGKNKNPTASFNILLLNNSKIQNHIEKLVVGNQPVVHDFSGTQIAVVYILDSGYYSNQKL
jgi:hypothetical protein